MLVKVVIAAAGLALVTSAAMAQSGCVSVKAGDLFLPAYDCLNARLSDRANQEFARQNLIPLPTPDALNNPGSAGIATPASASLQLGGPLGTPLAPFRPAARGPVGIGTLAALGPSSRVAPGGRSVGPTLTGSFRPGLGGVPGAAGRAPTGITLRSLAQR